MGEPAPAVAFPCGQQGATQISGDHAVAGTSLGRLAQLAHRFAGAARAHGQACPGCMRATAQVSPCCAGEHATKRVPGRFLATEASQGFAQAQPSLHGILGQVHGPAICLDRSLVVTAAAAHLAQRQEHSGQIRMIVGKSEQARLGNHQLALVHTSQRLRDLFAHGFGQGLAPGQRGEEFVEQTHGEL